MTPQGWNMVRPIRVDNVAARAAIDAMPVRVMRDGLSWPSRSTICLQRPSTTKLTDCAAPERNTTTAFQFKSHTVPGTQRGADILLRKVDGEISRLKP